MFTRYLRGIEEMTKEILQNFDADTLGIQLEDSPQGVRVWVCIDGQCVLRARYLKEVHIQDNRTRLGETNEG